MNTFSTPFDVAKEHTIWLLEDSQSDAEIVQRAFQDVGIANNILHFQNTESLYAHMATMNSEDKPALILLDIHLPEEQASGKDALKSIRRSLMLKMVPVIAFSHTGHPEDVTDMYTFGASSFIKKSMTFEDTVEMAQAIKSYWLESVILPLAV